MWCSIGSSLSLEYLARRLHDRAALIQIASDGKERPGDL